MASLVDVITKLGVFIAKDLQPYLVVTDSGLCHLMGGIK